MQLPLRREVESLNDARNELSNLTSHYSSSSTLVSVSVSVYFRHLLAVRFHIEVIAVHSLLYAHYTKRQLREVFGTCNHRTYLQPSFDFALFACETFARLGRALFEWVQFKW